VRVRRVAILIALLVVGCGGSHKAASTPTPTPTATPTAAAKTADCQKLTQVAGQVTQALSGATGSGNDKAKQLLDDLATSAPQAIRGDVKTIADAYSQIVSALKQVGGGTSSSQPTPEELQKLQDVLAKLDQAKLNRANAHITSWVQQHC
jgi:hypothetical protein